MEEIVSEVEGLIKDGYKEITLLGQNVNSYGRDLYGDARFPELLRRIDACYGDFRVKFMTSHPKDAGHELIDTMAESNKLCAMLHLPVQAGSNQILEKMNRGYTREDYMVIAQYAKAKIPCLTLTSDVMVGFPGENEADFAHTLDLVRQVGFDSLFTFIFSPRSGTPAAEMEGAVPAEIKHQRLEQLMGLQNEISRAANEAMIGQTVRVLCEGSSKTDENILTGRTDSGKTVNFTGDHACINQFVNVKIEKATTWTLSGTAM